MFAFCGMVLVVGFLVYDRIQTRRDIRALRLMNEAIREREARNEVPPAPIIKMVSVPFARTTPLEATEAAAGRPTNDKALAPPPVSAEDQLVYLETVFRQQRSDASWSPEAREKLAQGLLRFAKQPNKLDAVECRSTLCRGHFTGSTAAECSEFSHGVVAQAPPYFWEGPYSVMGKKDARGDGCTVTMVFGREGTTLPQLE
jgi:hypothetical protein